MGHRNRVCALPIQYTKIKIELDRTLVYGYYRKPQNKGIILHSRAYHSGICKTEVLFKNFYETTAEVSSGPDEAQHTPNMVHKVEVMTTKPGKLASRSGSKRKDVG